MPYAFYVHECDAAEGGVMVKARTVSGHVSSGTTIRSMTYLTYKKVFVDGEYIKDAIASQETHLIEFGPLVLLGAAMTNADGTVPRGFGFAAKIENVPADLPLEDWLLSDLDDPMRF
ncbi:hypothetical protein [Deinococcus hohokamensis]|uniref:Uncharacterized protein n=1 Tax=Deinococcus hohokamensis TaxID=309883 RepID=A0ABV9I675_9DEIO